jgi:hypothetical protein
MFRMMLRIAVFSEKGFGLFPGVAPQALVLSLQREAWRRRCSQIAVSNGSY